MSIWRRLLLARDRPTAPRRARLEVETLEERATPTITYHGGALLPHVEVQPLYLGSHWVSNAADHQLAGQLNGFLGSLVNSSYMDMLTTAGYRVGRGTTSPAAFDPLNLDSTSVLSESTIRIDLQYAIKAGLVAGPDANRLYVIYIEPNVSVGMGNDSVSENDFLGYHGAFAGHTAKGQPADIRYAVLPYPGGTVNNLIVPNVTAFQSLTIVSSHEVVEACTDPDVNYGALGWYDNASDDEIADIVNLEFVTLNGYAVQRIADPHDQAMTPIGAAPLRAASFELLNGGQLYEHTASGWTFLRSRVASVSNQGIGIDGLAMVDVVLTNGQAYEYHDGGQWVPLLSSIKQACAGQGVSYVVTTDGRLFEYRDDTGTWSGVLASKLTSIDAGTDRYGVNMVAAISTTGIVYEISDATGSHVLCSSASAVSAGTQGAIAVLQTNGRAYQHNEVTGGWTYLGDHVTQVALGTDASGAVMVDLILTGGTGKEYRTGTGWTSLCASVAEVCKSHGGVVGIVLTNGYAYLHSTAGWTPLTSTVHEAA